MNRRKLELDRLLRENIRTITPYSSARNEYTGNAQVFLDANENYLDFSGGTRNRYPDPLQRELKKEIGNHFGVDSSRIFLGNGSDEAIDLLYRAFARPGIDRVVIQPPTYGVYSVFAKLNDVTVQQCILTESYQMNIGALRQISGTDPDTLKMLFICSPNNPTGNDIDRDAIREVLDFFPGIVIVDEAYQDFSDEQSTMTLLDEYENLVVLRTFSKAWALANIRMGMAFADQRIIEVLTNIKYPYNLSGIAQETALDAIARYEQVSDTIALIKKERSRVAGELTTLSCVEEVYDSAANFLLVRTTGAQRVYDHLKGQGIIIRNRSKEPGCDQSVRITIGSREENDRLIEALKLLEGER
jgi:histidinol-phosphate aminotransferase